MILQAINKQQPHYKIVGLTLIEMMLVVTIIAVATLTGIKLFKNRAEITVINTVATQMQSVAQGVITYYMLNKNQWPTTSTTPTTLTTLVDIDTKYPYFSQQTLCTPFPSDNSAAVCNNFAEIQGEAVQVSGYNAGYYNIVLTTDSTNSALAIAGKLPNAVANGNTVTMSITPPAQYFYWNPNKGWIVSAGVTAFVPNTGSSDKQPTNVAGGIYIPYCPVGFEGHVMFFPERYQTAYIGAIWGIHMAGVTNSGGSGGPTNGNNQTGGQDDNKNSSGTTPSGFPNYISTDSSASIVFQSGIDNLGVPKYAVTVGDIPDSDKTSVQHLAFFMTFCLPNGHWGTNYISYSWSQDGACSSSWLDFLKTYQGNASPQCRGDSNGFTQITVGSQNGY